MLDVEGTARVTIQHPTVKHCNPSKVGCHADFTPLVDLPYCDVYTGDAKVLDEKLRRPCVFADYHTLVPLGDAVGSLLIPTRIDARNETEAEKPSAENGYKSSNDFEVVKKPPETLVADIERYTLLITHSYERNYERGNNRHIEGFYEVCEEGENADGIDKRIARLAARDLMDDRFDCKSSFQLRPIRCGTKTGCDYTESVKDPGDTTTTTTIVAVEPSEDTGTKDTEASEAGSKASDAVAEPTEAVTDASEAITKAAGAIESEALAKDSDKLDANLPTSGAGTPTLDAGNKVNDENESTSLAADNKDKAAKTAALVEYSGTVKTVSDEATCDDDEDVAGSRLRTGLEASSSSKKVRSKHGVKAWLHGLLAPDQKDSRNKEPDKVDVDEAHVERGKTRKSGIFAIRQGDLMTVGKLLKLSGLSLDQTFNKDNETLRMAGTSINIKVIYQNLLPWWSTFGYKQLRYHYSVSARPAEEYKTEVVAKMVEVDGKPGRVVESRHGLFVTVNVAGQFGFFEAVDLIIVLTAAMGLLGGAVWITNMIARKVLTDGDQIERMMIQEDITATERDAAPLP